MAEEADAPLESVTSDTGGGSLREIRPPDTAAGQDKVELRVIRQQVAVKAIGAQTSV